MITFEQRVGPHPEVAYPDLSAPRWWREAKFGLFVHWGIYSVPGWATPRRVRATTELEAYTHHAYAEWYANTVRIPGSPTALHHHARYGEATYEDLLDRWHAESFDASAFARQAAGWGVRYVVPTTKHHDGCCLWDTATTDFSTARRGPQRDLIAEIADAVRAEGLRLGLYYSGALDWHESTFGPIESDADLFALRRNDPAFADLCARQLTELVDRFAPDVLWNDIEWPDAGKDDGPAGLAALFRHYRAVVPEGTVNDRWGVPARGFLTREYRATSPEAEPWEATRGIGRSFGYNRVEPAADRLTVAEAVRLLVRTVAAGGNLLLNVGLTASGRVPEEQSVVLDGLGAWLERYGDAIYATTAPHPELCAGSVVTTQGADGRLHVLVLDPERDLELPAPLAGLRLTDPGGAPVETAGGVLRLPDALRAEPVAVLTGTRP